MEEGKVDLNKRCCIKGSRGPWVVRRRGKDGMLVTSFRRPSEWEREKRIKRGQRRSMVTAKIFAGLRAEGNNGLPRNASKNDILKALCEEAGWHVEDDGTIYRKSVTRALQRWRRNSSDDSDDESYTVEEDTSDTGSSVDRRGPTCSRDLNTIRPIMTRSHSKRSPPRETPAKVDLAVIREMVRKGVARELAGMDIGKGRTQERRVDIDKGPLSKHIYKASMADFKYPTTLPNFRGSGDTQDPHNFVHSF